MTTSAKSVSDLLVNAKFLTELSESDRQKVARIATLETMSRATVLFEEGFQCKQLYLVLAGVVGLEMCLPRRGCMRLLTVGPGEIIGWSALLGDGRMTARAVTVDAVQLVIFPADQLLSLCESDHDIGYAVMKQLSVALSRRLLATRLQQLDLFLETQPAAERV